MKSDPFHSTFPAHKTPHAAIVLFAALNAAPVILLASALSDNVYKLPDFLSAILVTEVLKLSVALALLKGATNGLTTYDSINTADLRWVFLLCAITALQSVLEYVALAAIDPFSFVLLKDLVCFGIRHKGLSNGKALLTVAFTVAGVSVWQIDSARAHAALPTQLPLANSGILPTLLACACAILGERWTANPASDPKMKVLFLRRAQLALSTMIVTGLCLYPAITGVSAGRIFSGITPTLAVAIIANVIAKSALLDARVAFLSIWPTIGITPGTAAMDDSAVLHWDTAALRRALPAFNISAVHKNAHDHHPTDETRPKNQFYTPSELITEKPIVTLMTVTFNPTPILKETAQAILQQSIQAFEWVVVNDNSTKNESIALLNELAKMDPRFKVVTSDKPRGVAGARACALEQVRTPYQVFVDDDDMFELNALEKGVWLLESNPQLHLTGFFTKYFGAAQGGNTHGFHSGSMMRDGNQIHLFNGGLEDEDFWWCIANNGFWGATIPEFNYWYRKWHTRERVWKWSAAPPKATRWPLANDTSLPWPMHDVLPTKPFDVLQESAPFSNILQPSLGPSALLVLENLSPEPLSYRTLEIVADLAASGWRVTVIVLAHESDQMRADYLQYTHDLFVLPLFLRGTQYPAFLEYLISSRGIATFLIADSPTAYGILDSLKLPHGVSIVDIVHRKTINESAIHGKHLHRTLATSEEAQHGVISHGRSIQHVALLSRQPRLYRSKDGIVYPSEKLRQELLSVHNSTCLIAYRAEEEYADLVGKVTRELNRQRPMLKFSMVPAVGPAVQKVAANSTKLHIQREVDGDDGFLELTAASDMLLVLSKTSSVFALTSLSFGVPIVTADLTTSRALNFTTSNLAATTLDPPAVAQRIIATGFCMHQPEIHPRVLQAAINATTTIVAMEKETLIAELRIASQSGVETHLRSPGAHYALRNALRERPRKNANGHDFKVMLVANKAVLMQVALPVTFLWIQLLIAVGLLHAGDALGFFALPQARLKIAKTLWPLVAINVVGLTLNTYTIQLGDASFYQIARGLVLPLTVALSWVYISRPSNMVLTSCVIITAGYFLGTSLESSLVQISSAAVVFGALSSATTAMHTIIIKQAATQTPNTVDLVYYNNLFSAACLPVVILLSGEGATCLAYLREFTHGESELSVENYRSFKTFVLGCLITGTFGFALNLASFFQIKVTSPTSHVISSAARGVYVPTI
ncbi:hypothetical protein HDU88_002300 [Geranomyces variabilis]|nr:hypothetical protein HDU88_002300 [Geranomyces variabilis]